MEAKHLWQQHRLVTSDENCTNQLMEQSLFHPLDLPPVPGSLWHALRAVAGVFCLSGTVGWFHRGHVHSCLSPGHHSATHQSQVSCRQGSTEECEHQLPRCSASGALHPRRADHKLSTAAIGNFQNQSLRPPKQAFENHISYLSPTYEAQELLLGFVRRKREAGKTVCDNPHVPQLISCGKFICLPLKINWEA